MQDLYNTNEQERFFVECVTELKNVNKEIEALQLRKEELTHLIIETLDHAHEGVKTYDYGNLKLEVKTPFVYALDKKKYESGEFTLPDNFNPVKQSVSYSIDKRLCDRYMNDAPHEVRAILAELIDKKPGKAGITIKERV